MKLVDELRRLVQGSDAPRVARLAEEIRDLRRREAAQAWAVAALPHTVEALKVASAAGVERVELTAGALPRRLRRVPIGGLAELAILLRLRGLKADPSRYGFVLSWEE